MKKYWLFVLTIGCIALVAGCRRNTYADDAMTLSTFGISTKQMARDVTKPFEKKYHTAVKTESGDSATRYTQIKHNPNNGVDIIELSQNNALSANQQGLFKKIDFTKIKNFNSLSPDAQKLAKTTNSIPYTINSVGIIYNSKKVGKITSWDQLWDKKFKAKIAIPDITTTFGPAMLYIAGDHAGVPVTKDQGKAAFTAMKELKPNVVKTYTQSSDLANMFKNEEIDVAVVGDFAVDMIQQSVPKTTYTVPASGTYANYDTVSVLKKSKATKADYDYINFRLAKGTQQKAAKLHSLNNAPISSAVQLSARDAQNKTYGSIAKRAHSIDYNFVNKHLSTWISKWNQLMNK